MTRVEICCGVGGTGKTTASAALAVSHAIDGERVAVLTIDPARRLADALGAEVLGNTPRPVHVPGATGSLEAMMLDRKGTWDAIVQRRASAETAEKLLENQYYKAVSTRLTGSHEYMAIEKLHDLVTDGDYDVVVVDTPPTQHVVDFFRAPERVRGILDRSLLGTLLEPGTRFRGAAARGASTILRGMAGDRVMSDIREFFGLIGEMSAGFRERSAEVATLLASERTRYLLVTDADAPERNDLLGFLQELRERDMQFAGFLVNRFQVEPTGPWPERDALLAAGEADESWPEVVDALLGLPDRARARFAEHQHSAAALVSAAGGAPAWLIP